MRRLLLGALIGAAIFATPLAVPASAGHKTDICHFDDNDNVYIEISVATKQLDKGKGHAKHEHDVIPAPDEGCDELPVPEDEA